MSVQRIQEGYSSHADKQSSLTHLLAELVHGPRICTTWYPRSSHTPAKPHPLSRASAPHASTLLSVPSIMDKPRDARARQVAMAKAERAMDRNVAKVAANEAATKERRDHFNAVRAAASVEWEKEVIGVFRQTCHNTLLDPKKLEVRAHPWMAQCASSQLHSAASCHMANNGTDPRDFKFTPPPPSSSSSPPHPPPP
jgi:hypothetical protein